MEYWNDGTMEYWNDGTMEYWNTGILEPRSNGMIVNINSFSTNSQPFKPCSR